MVAADALLEYRERIGIRDYLDVDGLTARIPAQLTISVVTEPPGNEFALRCTRLDGTVVEKCARPHISVSRFASRVWSVPLSVVCPCIAEWGWSRQRVIGLVRRRAGLPVMSVEISVCLYAAWGSPDRLREAPR